MTKEQLRQMRKMMAALVGALAQAANLGLLSGSAQAWATVAISVGVAAGVYVLPNDAKEPFGPLTSDG